MGYLEVAEEALNALMGDEETKPEHVQLLIGFAQAQAQQRIAVAQERMANALEKLAACVGGKVGSEKFWTASD